MAEDSGKKPNGHEERVHEAFDALHEELGAQVDEEARGSLEKLREAAADRDGARFRAQLEDVRARHGWLYGELSKHPKVAWVIDELALMGL